VKTKKQPFEVPIPNLDHTGIAERVKVSVPVYFDESINEWVLTEEAHQIIDDTKARHLGLVLPAQMKELRERLGFSQSEMGRLLQIGEKSWSRWECGKHRPTRSLSLLILALYDGKVPLDYLLNKAGMKAIGTTLRNEVWERKVIPFDPAFRTEFSATVETESMTG
jgi:transcriptional regulator with XRE-family HTH domain